MTLFEDKEENIEKIDQCTGNSSLSQSDSPLVDILSSLLKDQKNVPILTSNIKISFFKSIEVNDFSFFMSIC